MSEHAATPLREPGRVAILGGGLVGLGVGWRLAQAGVAVDVFEQGEAGRGASWAAAGMLAAGVEAEPGEERLYALNRMSQELWPDFAREVEAASGVGIGYRREGTLVVAPTRDDAEGIRFNLEFQQRLGVQARWLSGRDVLELEPWLRPDIAGGVYSPDDHQVDNRRLVLALKQAFLAAGGRLHEHGRVDEILFDGGRACGVRLGDARHEAEAVLLAAGPWSRAAGGLPRELRPPVRPIKGQMLALHMEPDNPLLRHVLWAPRVYLVPREDGQLIVGGTVEERGFDDRLTAGGVLALLEAAWRAVPAVEELPIDEFWVGFRPGSRDDAPILGPTPIEGLFMATGHHRNGVLLAPLTAAAMSRLVLTGERDPAIAGFGLERFARRRGSHFTEAT